MKWKKVQKNSLKLKLLMREWPEKGFFNGEKKIKIENFLLLLSRYWDWNSFFFFLSFFTSTRTKVHSKLRRDGKIQLEIFHDFHRHIHECEAIVSRSFYQCRVIVISMVIVSHSNGAWVDVEKPNDENWEKNFLSQFYNFILFKWVVNIENVRQFFMCL